MDILKKMFETSKHQGDNCRSAQFPKPNFGDEFRKPVWFDDCESDDELYDGNRMSRFQIFTNPLEMQKHFEQQMQEVLRSLEQFDGTNAPLIDENVRENYMKPGFEDFANVPLKPDSDLDGEIYVDQLHSLLQRISPELEALIPSATQSAATAALHSSLPHSTIAPAVVPPPVRRTDEQVIWDRIHGTADPDTNRDAVAARPRKSIISPRGGIFEGAFQGPKVFRQSVMTQTVRRPDGTYETRRVVKDADGSVNTTVTKTLTDGSTVVVSSGDTAKKPAGSGPGDVGGGGGGGRPIGGAKSFADDRNVYVTKEGYAMPKNIW